MGITDSVKKVFTQHKSMEELEEEDEREEIQLSIAQKKAAILELQRRGGSVNDFREKKGGISFSKLFTWLKTH